MRNGVIPYAALILIVALFFGPLAGSTEEDMSRIASLFESSFAQETVGNVDRALRDVLTVLQVKPAHYIAHYRAAWLYYLKGNSPRLSCVEARTGRIFYEAEKLHGMRSCYASPVAANGLVYVADRKGTCTVIREGPELEIVARNRLDDDFDASPAIAGNELFLRGMRYLYCVSE